MIDWIVKTAGIAKPAVIVPTVAIGRSAGRVVTGIAATTTGRREAGVPTSLLAATRSPIRIRLLPNCWL
jgi:hypothetical protein